MFVEINGEFLKFDGHCLFFSDSVAHIIAMDIGGTVIDPIEYYI